MVDRRGHPRLALEALAELARRGPDRAPAASARRAGRGSARSRGRPRPCRRGRRPLRCGSRRTRHLVRARPPKDCDAAAAGTRDAHGSRQPRLVPRPRRRHAASSRPTGSEVGIVEHVLAVADADVFDGVIVDMRAGPGGHRFADAAQVEAIYERGVVLDHRREAAEQLPSRRRTRRRSRPTRTTPRPTASTTSSGAPGTTCPATTESASAGRAARARGRRQVADTTSTRADASSSPGSSRKSPFDDRRPGRVAGTRRQDVEDLRRRAAALPTSPRGCRAPGRACSDGDAAAAAELVGARRANRCPAPPPPTDDRRRRRVAVRQQIAASGAPATIHGTSRTRTMRPDP